MIVALFAECKRFETLAYLTNVDGRDAIVSVSTNLFNHWLDGDDPKGVYKIRYILSFLTNSHSGDAILLASRNVCNN